jgi:hypothetical protein
LDEFVHTLFLLASAKPFEFSAQLQKLGLSLESCGCFGLGALLGFKARLLGFKARLLGFKARLLGFKARLLRYFESREQLGVGAQILAC